MRHTRILENHPCAEVGTALKRDSSLVSGEDMGVSFLGAQLFSGFSDYHRFVESPQKNATRRLKRVPAPSYLESIP